MQPVYSVESAIDVWPPREVPWSRTIVDGRILMRSRGKLLTIDEPAVIAKAEGVSGTHSGQPCETE